MSVRAGERHLLLCVCWALPMALFASAFVARSPADVFAEVAEATADGYELIYTLPIPDRAAFSSSGAIPYTVDNSDSFGQPFDRIAYYLELDTGSGLTYAYASMEAFTSDLGDLGLPADGQAFQQGVSDLNVFSNSSSVTSGQGLATGNIEFWNTNYAAGNAAGVPGASESSFDFGDTVLSGGSYSSFQVHNHGAGETILAYNQWAGFNTSVDGDLGIGNRPGGNPDWTFSQSAGSYTVKNLQVLVRPTGLSIDTALNRAVFQRDDLNRADVPLKGLVDPAEAVSIEARAVPREGYSGLPTEWTTIDASLQSGSWDGSLNVASGWYDIEVRSRDAGGAVIDQRTVERVGVGEVFVIAGQSNSSNWGQPTQSPEDDRVSAFDLNRWRLAEDPQPIADQFGGSPWPALGDLLVDEFEVPVGFVSVGVGGTRVDQWEPGAPEGLYDRLRAALEALGPDGARAVLWHQGEADNAANTSTADYVESLEAIIQQSRLDAGHDVEWGIALASFAGGVDANVLAAQQQVADADPLNFVGAATDDLIGPAWRYDGLHFNQAGLSEHASRWFDRLVAQVIPEPLSGDYNGDGQVDAADYTIWRDQQGQSVTLPNQTPGATTPGVVDQEDYDYWASRYGVGSNSSGAIPEPSGAAALTFGLLLIRQARSR